METETKLQGISGKERMGMSRDAIKYVAMFTMLLNHIAHVFFTRGTPLYEIFEDIGYFTAPVMCYFMVEGFAYTRSKMKYGFRLLLFAVISQIPYTLAFHYGNLNMIYTLLCCFLILTVMERIWHPFLKTLLCILLTLVTCVGDWAFLAPIYTVLFYNSRGRTGKTAFSFGVAYVLFVLLNIPMYAMSCGAFTLSAVIHAMFAGGGIIAAAVVVLVFYNGRRSEKGRNFAKWFFYIFYPAHLMILYLMKKYIDSVGAVFISW